MTSKPYLFDPTAVLPPWPPSSGLVETSVPPYPPPCLRWYLTALPIVLVAWLIPARLATCGPHLMALGMTCRGAAMSPCFKAVLLTLAAAPAAAVLAATRLIRSAMRVAAAMG
jgi:hypothetical protein